jgi:hypothetical protein
VKVRAMTYAELREAIDDEIADLEYTRFANHVQRLPLEQELDLANQLRNEAENLAAAGLIANAKHRLGCFLSPKWQDVESCEDDYNEAMNR